MTHLGERDNIHPWVHQNAAVFLGTNVYGSAGLVNVWSAARTSAVTGLGTLVICLILSFERLEPQYRSDSNGWEWKRMYLLYFMNLPRMIIMAVYDTSLISLWTWSFSHLYLHAGRDSWCLWVDGWTTKNSSQWLQLKHSNSPKKLQLVWWTIHGQDSVCWDTNWSFLLELLGTPPGLLQRCRIPTRFQPRARRLWDAQGGWAKGISCST